MEFLAVMKRIRAQPAQSFRQETARSQPGFMQPLNMPQSSSPADIRNFINFLPQMFNYRTNDGQQSYAPDESPCSSADPTSPQSELYDLS